MQWPPIICNGWVVYLLGDRRKHRDYCLVRHVLLSGRPCYEFFCLGMSMKDRNLKISVAFFPFLLMFAGCNHQPTPSAGSAGGTGSTSSTTKQVELLNVSYDPTRELYRDINQAFATEYEKTNGVKVSIRQSHGGSSSQARAIADGLSADVATLALWLDTDLLRKAGLVKEGWEKQFPNRSLPYISTIVFVVRKGNPKQIKDWPDLVKPGVQVITPNPKTGGNGKLSFLAAWGQVIINGGDDAAARDYVTKLYANVPVLDTAARAATATFAQKKIGDVHLTWENEARLEVAESKNELEVIYPSRSILAEPHVAVVDQNVSKKPGAKEAAAAYLQFLYTPAAQEIIAKHGYRPIDPAVLAKHESQFPKLELFTLDKFTKGWTTLTSGSSKPVPCSMRSMPRLAKQVASEPTTFAWLSPQS